MCEYDINHAASCIPPTGDRDLNPGMCHDQESNQPPLSAGDDAQLTEPPGQGMLLSSVPVVKCQYLKKSRLKDQIPECVSALCQRIKVAVLEHPHGNSSKVLIMKLEDNKVGMMACLGLPFKNQQT